MKYIIYILLKLIYNIIQCEELGLEANTKAVLEDVGHNTDLYIANQEDNTQRCMVASSFINISTKSSILILE